MKRTMRRAWAAAAAAVLLSGAAGAFGGRDGGGHGGAGGMGRGSMTHIFRRRRVSVPQPNRISNPGHVASGRARTEYPRSDGRGAPITKSAASSPPSHHAAVARNGALMRGIEAQQRTERTPRHYYWHDEGGVRYSHYYDGHVHWYGFYHGPTFYWTRYYYNRWWWFDARFGGRWVYWWDGFWWWPGPGGAAYVYVDNAYYPYDQAGVTVASEEDEAPPANIPGPDAGAAIVSPDGKRSAEIFGSDAQAFLFDKTTTPPTYLKFLGSGVAKVKFSTPSAAGPAQILVEFKDGTFAMDDADGNSLDAAASKPPATTPPPTPDSIPPPPTSAPGQ